MESQIKRKGLGLWEGQAEQCSVSPSPGDLTWDTTGHCSFTGGASLEFNTAPHMGASSCQPFSPPEELEQAGTSWPDPRDTKLAKWVGAGPDLNGSPLGRASSQSNTCWPKCRIEQG